MKKKHRERDRGPVTCCYCLRSQGPHAYKGREHVIPQAFGTFEPNNLIARSVCDDCNAHLGRALDEPLARASYEGLMRYLTGTLPASDYHSRANSRVSAQAASGPWSGMHVEQIVGPDGATMAVQPRKQVGLSARLGEQPEYFLPEQMPSRDECVRRFGTSDLFVNSIGFDDPDELRRLLEAKGFRQDGGLTEDPSVMTEGVVIRVGYTATVDRLMFRAFAKMAFNYLIALQPAIARMPAFDEVRRFIRDDADPSFRVLHMRGAPVIANEPRGGRFHGHVLTLRHDERRTVASNVSLFNQIHYRVVLAIQPFSLFVPAEALTSGHFFDVHHRTITRLTHGSELMDHLAIKLE